MRPALLITCLWLMPCLGVLPASAGGALYQDARLPVEARVRDLLSRMTLQEKVAAVDLYPNLAELLKHRSGSDDLAQTLPHLTNGIGAIEYDTKLSPEEFGRFHEGVQRFLMTQTRLGIPALFDGEACHGFVGTNATVFPVPLTLASSWDPELVERVFTAVALEMRAYGITHAATPVLDLAREPRFGRFDEFYSEDPYLVGKMGVGAIRGLQGRSQSIGEQHLLACAKHFTGHGQPEGGANMGPADLSVRVIREMHCYPFEQAVKQAGVRTVMAAYTEIDGVPSSVNRWLLTEILRGEWGFDGAVISDYDGVSRTIDRQHVCASSAEAARRALEAGLDFELPSTRTNDCFQYLPELVASGQVGLAALDRAVSAMLRNKFLLGLFENPYAASPDRTRQVMHSVAHRALALEAAEKGVVLLKNQDHTLPFSTNAVQRLAVIGANAASTHYGSYSATTPGVSILEGLKAYKHGWLQVRYAEGFKIYDNDDSIPQDQKTVEAEDRRISEAVAVARDCDAVLLVLGENENVCREAWSEDHSGDRDDLSLLGRQEDLARAVLALGKPTAVLLINGRPLAINWLAANTPAILEGWYLGEEQGTAVARLLFGDANPGGKLTVTFPRSVGQLPAYYNRKSLVHERRYVSGPYTPLYPFGHGLSYTTFRYTQLSATPTAAKAGQPIQVRVNITNTGERTGDEVAQLYLRDVVSSVSRPLMELKDFRRITLVPGEERTVEFQITAEQLQFYNVDLKRVVEPGEFKVMVGTSSEQFLSATFRVID